MMWMDDLREELQRGPAPGRLNRAGPRRPTQTGPADEAVARADALVRTLLDQLNQTLLGGRGSVWSTPAAWGVHLWELWWEPTREGGRYLMVTLLRDSRGTLYLRVQGRRLALEDARLERRLQRALRAAFLEPRVYTPGVRAGSQESPRSAPLDFGRAGNVLSNRPSDVPPAGAGAEAGDRVDENRGRSTRARRRGRHNGREGT